MIWRCIDQRKPTWDHENEWLLFVEYEIAQAGGRGYGQGPEYMIGFMPDGNGYGCGFDHGTLKGGSVDYGNR